MTVGPGTPVYGTKTKSRDSAAGARGKAVVHTEEERAFGRAIGLLK
jgi:hypothetical protein